MIELTNNIFYISIDDSDGSAHSDFFSDHKNTVTNNAYIVKGEKTALIDIVNEAFSDEYIKAVETLLPISSVDYLICNYTGNEFTGSIRKILSINPDIEIVGTVAAIKHIKEMLNIPFKEHIAKNGGELDMGEGEVLRFTAAPNLPWPDTMCTYAIKEKALFSGRLFSSYISDYSKSEMMKYFNNMLSPFKPFVHKAVQKISVLDINIICTANGHVIRKDISAIINEYFVWSTEDDANIKKAAVVCPKSWGSTALMAEFIRNKLQKHGFNVTLYPLSENYMQAIQEINDYEIIAFGTNTINKNASMETLNLIANIKTARSKNKHCIIFGSYGWSGEGLQILYGYLKLLKFRVFEKPFGVCFNPSQDDYSKLDKFIEHFLKNTEEWVG